MKSINQLVERDKTTTVLILVAEVEVGDKLIARRIRKIAVNHV